MNRFLMILFVVGCAYFAWKHFGISGSGAAADEMSIEQIKALAATVEPDEVVMYSTTVCPHCSQAKGWLNRYGFAFTECNMSVSSRCEQEFTSYGGDGTPYLVVRGHHMKDGFDSDEFLAALKQ